MIRPPEPSSGSRDLAARLRLLVPLLGALSIVPGAVAQAHTTERAYILLLPTTFYMVGGALVVAVSFVLAALILWFPKGIMGSVRERWL